MNKLKTRYGLRMVGLFTLAAGLIFTAACKKSAPPAPAQAPEAMTQLPMPAPHDTDGVAAAKKRAESDAEMEKHLDKEYAGKPAEKEAIKSGMRALDALGDAMERLDAINQRIMVIPAPADFRPEPVARKVRLTLILESSKIRAGEAPRFRLELTNVGREAIDYQEYESSIFKWGSILHSISTIHFSLTDQAGKRRKLHADLHPGRAASMRYHKATPESEKEMQEIIALGKASTTFKVKLRPGDTLRSLGDGNSAQEPFRTLFVEEGFNKPGVYQLQVELDDRPTPLSAGYIEAALEFSSLDEIKKTHERRMSEALGPVSSTAKLEVVP